LAQVFFYFAVATYFCGCFTPNNAHKIIIQLFKSNTFGGLSLRIPVTIGVPVHSIPLAPANIFPFANLHWFQRIHIGQGLFPRIFEEDVMEEDIIKPIRYSADWFLSQLYQSNHPDSETMRILQTLNKYVRLQTNRDIFYERTIRSKSLNDLADDCLLIVSLFNKHIKELHRRHAAPPTHWYVMVGTNSFERLGYYDIARNYDFWVCFIREHVFA
jgi:hypothetical protein